MMLVEFILVQSDLYTYSLKKTRKSTNRISFTFGKYNSMVISSHSSNVYCVILYGQWPGHLYANLLTPS